METRYGRHDEVAEIGCCTDQKAGRSSLPVRIDMGRKWLATADVAALEPGCIIELDRLVDDDADMYVDGKLFAKGQPVAVNGTCAMRVQEIVASNAQARLAGRKPR